MRISTLLKKSPIGNWLGRHASAGQAQRAPLIAGRVDRLGYRRIKAWSDACETARPEEVVTFGMRMASRETTQDWPHHLRLLSQTLSSVMRQTDPRFRIIMCGNEVPDVPEIADPRVEFIARPRPLTGRPKVDRLFADLRARTMTIGRRLRHAGGGYFMTLDCDDLVHRDVVKTVLESRHPNGFVFGTGYVHDWINRLIAPVPGAWPFGLQMMCGSTSMLFLRPEDLPGTRDDPNPQADQLFRQTLDHRRVEVGFQEFNRPLDQFGFPAVIYVVNHSQNLSFLAERSGVRGETVRRNIRRHAIADPDELGRIDAGFGTDFARRRPAAPELKPRG